ncbi:MAG: regulatory protein RecX, partial [Actinomycetes bacterium]
PPHATAPDPPTREQAREYLLNSLNYAPRTRQQLDDLLAKRNTPPDIAKALLDRFEEVGLINDGEFAQAWVRYRHASKGLSRRALARELSLKGVSQADIEAALEQVDAQDERDAAFALAERKVRALARFDAAAQQRKLVAMLMRRGHAPGVASDVAREVVARTLVE